MQPPEPMPRKQAAGYIYELTGRKVSQHTIWKWATFGVKGIKLEHIFIGGRLFVTREAIQKFFEELTKTRVAKIQARRIAKEAIACESPDSK